MDKPNIFQSSKFYMSEGDILHLLVKDLVGDGISIGLNNGETDVVEDIEEITQPIPPVPELDLIDRDSNIYTTVTIGAQEWMVENFKCTKYADGALIPNIIISEYNDWFLPAWDELNEMYVNLYLFGVGGFSATDYWSSSEVSANNANAQTFDTGQRYNDTKNDAYSVRACRSFIDVVGAYSLRDIGPAGGLIFYIDGAGTTYYEAAPSDQSIGKRWSNIINVAIGTTGTAIGTGQGNTTAIIAQVGHTDSAAKLCNDLTLRGWVNDTNGAYCWRDNNIANKTPYGAIYNWYAVSNASGLAYLSRGGIEEYGWRVPTGTDWTALQSYLGGTLVAGGKLKETGIAHWQTPNTGATNDYGFSALPTGTRTHDTGAFAWFPTYGFIWGADEFDATYAYYTWFMYNGANMGVLGNGVKKTGMAVRLVRDVT